MKSKYDELLERTFNTLSEYMYVGDDTEQQQNTEDSSDDFDAAYQAKEAIRQTLSKHNQRVIADKFDQDITEICNYFDETGLRDIGVVGFNQTQTSSLSREDTDEEVTENDLDEDAYIIDCEGHRDGSVKRFSIHLFINSLTDDQHVELHSDENEES